MPGRVVLSNEFPAGSNNVTLKSTQVPLGEVNLLPLPDNLADERALWLSDVLPTSYHAIADTAVDKGDVVGVWVRVIFIGAPTRTACSCGVVRVSVQSANVLFAGRC